MYKIGKRLFDILLSSLALLVLAPLPLLIALAVLVVMGRPVFFRQQRPGRYGKLFTLLKFRTMREGGGTDVERLTRLGRFLRCSSLDELPELVNVLKGEMSLVGPRPLLPKYMERYSVEQARRHEVRPGITGWAQVNGRNAISWPQKLEMDVWYVDNSSFWLDLKILWLTIWRVLCRDGVFAGDDLTMPEFMGEVSSKGKDDTEG